MHDLLLELAKAGGPVGVCLALAYLYIREQHRALREVESKRVADAQAMVSKLLELNDKWNETLNSHIEVAEAQKQLLLDLKLSTLEQHRAFQARRPE